MKADSKVQKLIEALEAYRKVAAPLAKRWRDTKEWHKPEFRDGEIHIDTGDLADFNRAEKLALRALKGIKKGT